jgi:phage shock protein A
MGILNRLGRIFKSEANAAIDKAEDATKISEQILRELNEKLEIAIKAEAEVKAIDLKNKSDLLKAKNDLAGWENRLNGILDRIDKGEDLTELSKNAATHYNECNANVKRLDDIVKISTNQVDTMEKNITHLRDSINSAHDKATNISSRQKVAEATETINKAINSSNIDGLMNTLDRMENKISATEFVAESYASTPTISDEKKIDDILNKNSIEDTLTAFRNKRK